MTIDNCCSSCKEFDPETNKCRYFEQYVEAEDNSCDFYEEIEK